MFRCDGCNKVTKPGEPMTKKIAERRRKTYENPKNGKITTGWEIVKEISLCQKCARKAGLTGERAMS